jgi:hypothetical protein
LRRYLIGLGRRLGMTTSRLLRELDSQEISEQMAFDLLETENTRRALSGISAPLPTSPPPTTPPARSQRQSDDELRAHAEAVFTRWPGVKRISLRHA